jgi:NADH dehydrogenase [ubiquinone] 1 alpha subcomplex assembly factor 5
MRFSKVVCTGRYFDDGVKLLQREAAARKQGTDHTFLWEEHAASLCERLLDLKEPRLERVLDRSHSFGPRAALATALRETFADEVKEIVHDEGECDVALSLLSMHWVDDLDAELSAVRGLLKPDSPFLGVMYSSGSLDELRSCLALSDMERLGGVVPHVSPLITPNSLSIALQANGFGGVCVDESDSTPTYSSTLTMLDELWRMGERG